MGQDFISYARNFEDVILYRLFKDKASGFYIDVGAGHPLYDSSTQLFYQKGWRGINIEPNLTFWKLLQQEREDDINLNLALDKKEGIRDLFVLEETAFSTLNLEQANKLAKEKSLEIISHQISTETLAKVCHNYVKNSIDFLKIDVNGWEKEVILGHDWENFRPSVLIVRVTTDQEFDAILFDKQYFKVYFDGLNNYYLAQEAEYFKYLFVVPPNLSDNFTLYKVVELQTKVDRLYHFELQSAIFENRWQDEKIENQRLNEALKKLESIKKEQTEYLQNQLERAQNQLNQLNYQLAKATERIVRLESLNSIVEMTKNWIRKKRLG